MEICYRISSQRMSGWISYSLIALLFFFLCVCSFVKLLPFVRCRVYCWDCAFADSVVVVVWVRRIDDFCFVNSVWASNRNIHWEENKIEEYIKLGYWEKEKERQWKNKKGTNEKTLTLKTKIEPMAVDINFKAFQGSWLIYFEKRNNIFRSGQFTSLFWPKPKRVNFSTVWKRN